MLQRFQSNEIFEIDSISNANEFFEISSNVLLESKIFILAKTIHLSNSETKISSIDSMSKLFTTTLIFDKLHDICFKINKNSLTTNVKTNHLSNSKAKISFNDSISLDFTTFALIFDKSHNIFFKISEKSSTKQISNDDFCKFAKTIIHLTYFETINFAKISLFVIFTTVQIFDISNRICFKICKNS